MTGPDPWQDEPPDALEAALDRYARAFPKAGLPFLRGAAGPEARQVAVELLDRATEAGRPRRIAARSSRSNSRGYPMNSQVGAGSPKRVR